MADNQTTYGAAVLTISTGGAEGTRQDTSGPAAQELLRERGFTIVATALVRDDIEAIREVLVRWVDTEDIPLIVTSGGTGLAPYDLTPEATLGILDREAPGIAEAMRGQTLTLTPMAMTSRSVAGTRKRSLIINLPGSPKGVRECLTIVAPVLQHAVSLIRGNPTQHV
jgi:molybdopterin adenylyltransferase